MNGKGDKQRINWSKEYETKYRTIYTLCEMCEAETAKRQDDGIYLCNNCNTKHPKEK